MKAVIRDLGLSVPAENGILAIADVPALAIGSGEMLALAGASGSGKTTLLYLLSGLLLPQRGSVAWGGVNISLLSERVRDRWRLDHAGFVFQSFNLIDELSPLENVLLPARFSGSPGRDVRVRASQLLDQFGVPNRRRASLLSRGEQQRVAMARAILRDPQVIFADEPTASLDGETGEQVANLLSGLSKREGMTVVVASHDDAILSRADRVLRLAHGRIVSDVEAIAA